MTSKNEKSEDADLDLEKLKKIKKQDVYFVLMLVACLVILGLLWKLGTIGERCNEMLELTKQQYASCVCLGG